MTTTADERAVGYRYVGKPYTRIEGRAKVTGTTLYTGDLKLPRMTFARLVRSPHAHARIRAIDPSAALARRGVVAVVTAANLRLEHFNPSNRTHHLLARDEVSFVGQPVAAVVAEDEATAEEAVELVRVEYEPLPHVIDPLEAMEPDAPLVREPVAEASDRSEERGHVTLSVNEQENVGKPTNIASQIRFQRGDVAAGLAQADAVVERRYRSGMVHQGYIEPHVTVADCDPDGELTIYTATQGPFHVRNEVSKLLGIPETRVRVVALELGGGFGGKIYLEQSLVAALAMSVRRPVRMAWRRSEDLLAATPAPQAVVDLKLGMKRDGELCAIQARLVYDSGAFPGAAMVAGAMLLGGSYRCPHLDIQGFEVLTNKASVGALRAPAAHNAAFAIECALDELCAQLGLDPLETRLRNAVGEGDLMPTGQAYPRIGLRQALEAVRDSDLWRRRGRAGARAASAKARGIGLAAGGWLGGLQPAGAVVALNSDGTWNVLVGSADITGVNTNFRQIAAEVLGVPIEEIGVSQGDTRTAPYAGMSAGSKTMYTVGTAVARAAEEARHQVLEIAADQMEVTVDDLEIIDGTVRVKGSPDRSLAMRRIAASCTGFGSRYMPVIGRGAMAPRRQAPGFAAQVAEVEVDTETGEVTVIDFVSAQDVGFAVNPLNVSGQIQGGTAQGIAIGLFEELQWDADGRLRNPTLLDYRMPTALDVPNITDIQVEVPSEEGPFGARIVGEPPIVPGGAAIANAIRDALGVVPDTMPFTPERVLRSLGRPAG